MTGRSLLIALVVCLTAEVQAQVPTNFSGTWELNTVRSQNIGMMSTMQDTVTVIQTPMELIVTDHSKFQGQESTRETRFDLTGKPVTNSGPMGDRNETVAKWSGPKLVVIWTADGAVAGTKVVRTETRSLSADDKN